MVGEASGSTPTTLTPPPYQAAMPGDKPAASNCDEERVDIGLLLLHLQPDYSLAQQGFTLVESVDGERSRLRCPNLTRHESVGVPVTRDDQFGAIAPDPLDFHR